MTNSPSHTNESKVNKDKLNNAVDDVKYTNELREKILKWSEEHDLLRHFPDCDDSCNDSWMESKMIESLLDLIYQKQLALLDRIKESLNNHTTPEGRDLLTRSYINNTLEFERQKLEKGEL